MKPSQRWQCISKTHKFRIGHMPCRIGPQTQLYGWVIINKDSYDDGFSRQKRGEMPNYIRDLI